jgi:hypothetical protein
MRTNQGLKGALTTNETKPEDSRLTKQKRGVDWHDDSGGALNLRGDYMYRCLLFVLAYFLYFFMSCMNHRGAGCFWLPESSIHVAVSVDMQCHHLLRFVHMSATSASNHF